MGTKAFDPKKLDKLNHPDRLLDIPPQMVLDKLALSSAQVLVDVGAGTGFFSKAFLGILDSVTIYACDISDVMIQWMRANLCPDYPGIIPVKMDGETIPLEAETADLVFMITLHHELDQPVKLLKDCHRVLKSGGKVAVIDWKKEPMTQGPPQDIRCEPDAVKNQLITAGFAQIEVCQQLPKHFFVYGQK